MDPSSFCLPTLLSSVCGFYLLGHKMAAASPGLKSLSQEGKRRKVRVENTFSSGALPFYFRKQNFPQGLLPLYLVHQNSVILLSVTPKEAGVQPFLLSST